jgi:hypothetical protein
MMSYLFASNPHSQRYLKGLFLLPKQRETGKIKVLLLNNRKRYNAGGAEIDFV